MVGSAAKPRIVIIGAGFSGIGLGIELRKAGVDGFTILERGDGIGGCWRANTYPGVACDIPSRLYSFSFAPNPDWSRSFSPGHEIRDYIARCAQRFGVTPHVRPNVTVTAIRREDEQWVIETQAGERINADVVVAALGPLSDPKYPEIKGIETFQGAMFHSARWDHTSPLEGRDVGIIGSAASAAQIIPEVATVAASLTVFMRTPNWVIPRNDFAYSPLQKALVKSAPFLLRAINHSLFLQWEKNYAFIQKGSLRGKQLGRMTRRGMEAQVPEGPMREVLIPTYAPGCKRIIMSSRYLPALQRDNVKPITAPIASITKKGVRTTDGVEHVFDTLVLATGYKNFDISQSIDIVGPGGLNLRDVWRSRAVTHRTVAIPRFPNFFVMMGPNTGLGHNTVTTMIEAQARYIRKCIQTMRRRRLIRMTPKVEPAEAFYDAVQAQIGETVLSEDCNAWYKNGVDGKVHSIWPGTTRAYQKLLQTPAVDEFDLVPASLNAPRAWR
jgi:cation diffusion facilitator CzcD-associated flavoprotein CzcO